MAGSVPAPSAPRNLLTLGALVFVLAAAVLASLMWGAKAVSVADVVAALAGTGGQELAADIVASRVSRTIAGVAIGAALALAGAGLQGLTRNPLGDAGILGINAGAAFAVVLITSLLGARGIAAASSAAFVGAAAAMALVYVLASVGSQGPTPLKLALAGAILAAALSSATMALLMVSDTALDDFRFWQVGTLAARSTSEVLTALALIVPGALLLASTARAANAVALGDDMARALGFRLGVTRAIGGLAVVLLAGTATALAGPIAFVGLMVPHAMRTLVGSDYRWLLPASALGGPILLLAADTLGRVIAPPSEVQVGIMCALLGAPLLIVLVRRGIKGTAL
ncbi:FecCD family ABC transporter permease [Bowdeniella massiliensis]|uniref:FecCD family ABC transporter permease n=1 Tax=Bowdeniella massiliensis TaxID=2932264 RepID=UPI0020295791|nr:iron chelate uptake ABC transporter family permease subunit [Bowdeniella massiliensis]